MSEISFFGEGAGGEGLWEGCLGLFSLAQPLQNPSAF